MTLFYTLFISGLQILLFWSYKHNKNQDLSNKSLLHSSNKINTSCGTDHNIHDKVIFWLTELRGRVRVPPIDCPSPLLREACIGQCPQITFPYLSYFLKRPIRQRECEIIKFSCSRWNGDLFCTIVGIFFFRLCLCVVLSEMSEAFETGNGHVVGTNFCPMVCIEQEAIS